MNPAPQQPVAPIGKRRKPLHLPGILRRRAALLLVVGSLLAVVLAPLFWLSGGAVYTSTATLLIDPGKEPTLNGRERETIPGNLGDYTRTLLSRLTSGDVLEKALHDVPRTNWPSVLEPSYSDGSNLGLLFKAIKAKEVARTHLMTVEMSADSPRGLAPMLNAVIDGFVAKLRRELEQQNERRLTYLREERDQIVGRIAEERGRILALAEHIPNKAFLHENYSVHLSKLEQIQRLYWEAEAQRAARAGEQLRVESDRFDLQKLSLQAYADERVADNFGINRIEQWTYEQLQSLRSNIDGLTTNNEDRTYVEMRMDAMNEYLVKYKRDVNDLTIRILKEKREHDLTTEVVKASNALAAARSTSEELSTRLEQAKKEATDTSEAIFKASDMSFAVTQLRDRLTALNTRIDDCEMEAKAPLRITIESRPGAPTHPSSNSRPKLAMLAVLLAFGLVAGGLLGFEILDDRIRGRAEVDVALGGPAPDPIPALPEGAIENLLLKAPDSPAGNAVRSLAVRLNRERMQHQARIFAFVSIDGVAQDTAMALNVAHALGRHAPRVLMLSLGRTALTDLRGIESRPTAAPLLSDPEGLAQAVVHDAVRGIDLAVINLADGALPTKVGLVDLIAGIRSRYDAAVLDIGPVPTDDLALAVLQHCDAAVFAVHEDATMFQDLRRAIDAATVSGVPSLTALLTGSSQPAAGWVHRRIQQALRPVTALHHRAVDYWSKRLARKGPPPGGGTGA